MSTMNPFFLMVMGLMIIAIGVVVWAANTRAKQQMLEYQVEVLKKKMIAMQECNDEHRRLLTSLGK